MKILYFTDTHDMGRNPGSRIDDYHQAIMRKFKEVVDVAINNKVDAVVHGGDWWHTPKVANSIYNQHQRLLRKLRRHKIKVFLVPGNHDLYGYSMTTIDQTSIGSLAEAGLVTLLTRKKSRTITDGYVSIELHGREYSTHIDEDPLTDYQIVENTQADFNFLFAHGMLLQKAFHPDVKHTLTKDIITDADLVASGHYHEGYPTHTIGDTEFANPGSTGRDEGSTGSVKRIPQYMIIDADKSGYSLDLIEYACAQKGIDVFDRTQLTNKKQHVRYLEAFEQTIEDALAFEAFDPKDILAKTQGLDKKLLSDAMNAIVDQEKLVHDSKLDGFIPKQTAISIVGVEAENFQSHKNTKVDFDAKGLNAITGASDSGKSGLIRVVRWVLYNEPKGTDFIRHGESRATGTVRFSDGSSLTRSRTRSSAGEYIVRDTSGAETEFKGFGTNLPIEISNTHQMPRVELSPGVERSLNFSYQLDGHFLLSESPQTRASAIGRLTGVHVVDAAVKEKAKDIRRITIDTNSSEKRIVELDAELEQFTGLAETKRQIDALQTFIAASDKLEKKIIALEELTDEFDTHTDRMRDLKQELKHYAHVDKGVLAVQLAEERVKEITKLEGHLKDVRRYRKEVTAYTTELGMYEGINSGIDLIEKADTLRLEIKEMEAMNRELRQAEEAEAMTAAKLSKYKKMVNVNSIDHLDDMRNDIIELQQLHDDYEAKADDHRRLSTKVYDAKNDITDIEARIHKLMDEMDHKCPTCNQLVGTANINDMLAHV